MNAIGFITRPPALSYAIDAIRLSYLLLTDTWFGGTRYSVGIYRSGLMVEKRKLVSNCSATNEFVFWNPWNDVLKDLHWKSVSKTLHWRSSHKKSNFERTIISRFFGPLIFTFNMPGVDLRYKLTDYTGQMAWHGKTRTFYLSNDYLTRWSRYTILPFSIHDVLL